MVAESGLHFEQQVPSKVHRRELTAKVRKRRICIDDRNYAPVPFTIPGDVAVGKYEPAWPVDRDYWVARVTATVGRHDTGTHPSDGTPGGQALRLNVRVISADGTSDSALLASDTRIRIDDGKHRDAANANEDGNLTESDFNVPTLSEGEHVYVDVTQVGTTRAGRNLVVTLWLVPVRFAE